MLDQKNKEFSTFESGGQKWRWLISLEPAIVLRSHLPQRIARGTFSITSSRASWTCSWKAWEKWKIPPWRSISTMVFAWRNDKKRETKQDYQPAKEKDLEQLKDGWASCTTHHWGSHKMDKKPWAIFYLNSIILINFIILNYF